MIGKGKLFDLISRMADIVNNIEHTIHDMILEFKNRRKALDSYLTLDSQTNETDRVL